MIIPSFVSAQSLSCINGTITKEQSAIGGFGSYSIEELKGKPNNTGSKFASEVTLDFQDIFTSNSSIVNITIRAKADDVNHVGKTYKMSFYNGTSWSDAITSTDVLTLNFTDLTYTMPATLVDNYKKIRIERIDTSNYNYSQIDAVTVISTVCNPCVIGEKVPIFTNASNYISTTGKRLFDLTSVNISNSSLSKRVNWHYFLPVSESNKIQAGHVTGVLPGTYYVSLEGGSPGNLCYSKGVAFEVKGDYDNDGIVDAEDLDDDNDGILDILECPKNLTSSGSFEYVATDFVTPSAVMTTSDGSFYAVHLNTMFGTTNPDEGKKDDWLLHGTVDWTQGQYVFKSHSGVDTYFPLIKPSITDGGGCLIFSRGEEAISNNLTGLTIGKKYKFTYEMGFLPAYFPKYTYGSQTQPVGSFVGYEPSTTLNITGAIVLSNEYPDYLEYSASDFPNSVNQYTPTLDPHWKTYTAVFEATSTSVNVRFQAHNEKAVIVVDAVRVSEFPNLPICTRSLNTDSDGDGCLDSIEAGVDDGNGGIGSGTVGSNGVYDNLETSPDSGILKNLIDISVFPYDANKQEAKCVQVIEVSDVSVIEGGNLVHTVKLSGVIPGSITYNCQLSEGTATANLDYENAPIFSENVNLSAGKITVPAGVISFTVSYPTKKDILDENSETTTLSIGGISGTGTINDPVDSTIKSNGVSDATAIEGENLVHTITLNSETLQPVNYAFELSEGTATVNLDYENAPIFSENVNLSAGKITVPAGV
ncbi:hypothetical protein F6A46_12290, partial [Tenacibaculum finnmarkense genomovar ulcerans]